MRLVQLQEEKRQRRDRQTGGKLRDAAGRREIKNSPHSKTSWWERQRISFEKMFVLRSTSTTTNSICTFSKTNFWLFFGKVWDSHLSVCVMQHVVVLCQKVLIEMSVERVQNADCEISLLSFGKFQLQAPLKITPLVRLWRRFLLCKRWKFACKCLVENETIERILWEIILWEFWN